MGLIRLLIIFFVGYFLFRMVKRLIMPSRQNTHVRDQSDKSENLRERKNIQDIDYEEID